MARRLALACSFVIVGLTPALLVLWLGPRPRVDPWRPLLAEARARAAVVDVHARAWFDRHGELARQIAGLLRQIGHVAGQRSIGHAAEGTIVLHLQRHLGRDEAMGEYAVVDRRGRLLLSTDGTRVAGRPAPVVPDAQAWQRPVLALAGAPGTPAQLVVAAPIRSDIPQVAAAATQSSSDGGLPGVHGVLLALPRPATVARLLRATPGIATAVSIVDDAGRVLGGRDDPAAGSGSDGLRELGSESRPGWLWIAERPAAHVPLQTTRATVVALGPTPAPVPAPWRAWHLALLAGVLVAAALGTAIFGRSSVAREAR